MSREGKGFLLISITAIAWGFLAIALKFASHFLEPLTIVWLRFSLAFIFLALYCSVQNISSFKILKSPPLSLLIAALFLSFNYVGFMKGIAMTSPGNAQIIIQIGPILFALLSAYIFKEKIFFQQILGAMIALIGFLLFYQNKIEHLLSNSNEYLAGNIWLVFAAIAWALYSIINKKLIQKYSSLSLNLVIYLIASLLFLPFVHFDQLLILNWWQSLLVIFLGLNTLIAYGCLSKSFEYLDSSKISTVITLNPILTIVILNLLEHFFPKLLDSENITFSGYLGAFLVIVGAIFIVSKRKKN